MSKLTELTAIITTAVGAAATVADRGVIDGINPVDQGANKCKVFIDMPQNTGNINTTGLITYVFPFTIQAVRTTATLAYAYVETLKETIETYINSACNYSTPNWIRIMLGSYLPFAGETVEYNGFFEVEWFL